MSTTPRTDAAAGTPTKDREKVSERLYEESQKLERELAEARKDSERLDWMDAHEASIEVTEPDPLSCRVQASDDFRAEGYSNPYNVRAVIDAARTPKP